MKRSFRDYLLTLGLAVLIFTVAAFFLIQAAEGLMGDVVDKIGSSGEEPRTQETESMTEELPVGAQPQTSEDPAKKDETFTLLFLGVDYGEKNADVIFLAAVNATKKTVTVSLIPSNTVVPEATGRYKLGELYSSRGVNFYKEFVEQETGILPDYYVSMSMSALSNLIDFWGGLQFHVPENMYYFDPTQNLKINLQAGNQLLTGDQAVQLVAYRGYENGSTGRENLQIEFAKAFCSAFLIPENLSRAQAILYNVFYNVKTDFEEIDFARLGEMIFNFPSYSQEFVRIPGDAAGEYYAIRASKAKALFSSYK